MDIQSLAIRLTEADAVAGFSFDCQLIPGEVDVLQVSVSERGELPIYVSASDTQILCIVYLWQERDVRSETRTAMMEAMLDMNIPIPLSSFARLDDHFVLFGAMRREASLDAIVTELVTLSENAFDATDGMAEFLL